MMFKRTVAVIGVLAVAAALSGCIIVEPRRPRPPVVYVPQSQPYYAPAYPPPRY